MKKFQVSLLTVIILVFSLSTITFAAQSQFDWSYAKDVVGVTIVDPQSAVTVENTAGLPVFAVPIDKELNTGETDYADDEINFKIKITPNTSASNSFLGLFVLRSSDPGSPCWAPGVNASALEMDKGKITLTGKVNGAAITDKLSTANIDVCDGAVHSINIKVNDDTKTVSVVIDGMTNQTLQVTYTTLETEGGYQLYSQGAKVEMTEFNATNSKAVASPSSVASSKTVSSTAENSSSLITSATISSSVTSSTENVSSTISINSDDASSLSTTSLNTSNSSTSGKGSVSTGMFMIILIGAVVILGGAGVASYFLVFKKVNYFDKK